METFHKMSIDIGKDLEKHKPIEATEAESDNDEDYQEEIVDCLEDVPSDMMVNNFWGFLVQKVWIFTQITPKWGFSDKKF